LNTKDIRTLGKNDSVIVCGGSNDINKNEASVGLRQLKKFVSVTQDTNILIVTAPHRHDLQVSSCVNKEIEVFNRKLRKMMKTNSNVSVVHTNLSRSDFTPHGMHMNVSGKETMAVLLGQNIKTFMVKYKESPIVLKWEEAPIDLNQGEVKKNLVTEENREIKNKDQQVPSDCPVVLPPDTTNTSGRPKRTPRTRSDDFLWTATSSRTVKIQK
jgi:hypothetical protein